MSTVVKTKEKKKLEKFLRKLDSVISEPRAKSPAGEREAREEELLILPQCSIEDGIPGQIVAVSEDRVVIKTTPNLRKLFLRVLTEKGIPCRVVGGVIVAEKTAEEIVKVRSITPGMLNKILSMSSSTAFQVYKGVCSVYEKAKAKFKKPVSLTMLKQIQEVLSVEGLRVALNTPLRELAEALGFSGGEQAIVVDIPPLEEEIDVVDVSEAVSAGGCVYLPDELSLLRESIEEKIEDWNLEIVSTPPRDKNTTIYVPVIDGGLEYLIVKELREKGYNSIKLLLVAD